MTTTATNHNELIGKTATVAYQMMVPNTYGKLVTVQGEYRGMIADTTETESGRVYVAVTCEYIGIDPRIENAWHRTANVTIH